jgi:cellulose synthase/poly-beta-1,6-N-acetylglucosamine synthase-like glycosyltransferase
MVIQILTWVYVICTILLAVYTLGQLVLLFQYLRLRHKRPSLPVVSSDQLPAVTIQLPLYNERNVVTRLLNAVVALDYPREKLLVQVLDDSTDNTLAFVAAQVETLQRQGWQIEHLHRDNREGYKAGALAYGLTQLTTDFVAIFDADFVPPRHFLRETMPFLVTQDKLGVVQTAWGHLNADENWLTKAQRLSTDAHFVIEQTARNRSNWIVPFNGTGGIWRVKAIEEAGGWSSDTLTEDCDLSYRAQLKSWQALYLEHVIVPGELPPQIAAYRQQQARWAQGNTQCLKKTILPVMRTPMPFTRRMMAVHHLFQYVPQVLMLISLLVLPFLMLARVKVVFTPLGIISVIPPLLYIVSQYVIYTRWKSNLLAFPVLALLATGLIARNSLAVFKGLVTRGGTFKRTPKFADEWQGSLYALRGTTTAWVEIAFTLYAVWGATIAWRYQRGMLPYLLLYVLAFGCVALFQILEQRRLNQHSLMSAQINLNSASMSSENRFHH